MGNGTESVGKAILYGFLVPPGIFYLLTNELSAGILRPLGDLVVIGWLAVIGIGMAGLVIRYEMRGDTGLCACIGIIGGFAMYAFLVGWSFVLFPIVVLSLGTIIVGTWAGYEWLRYGGAEVKEPPFGSWRQLFMLISLIPVIIVALILIG